MPPSAIAERIARIKVTIATRDVRVAFAQFQQGASNLRANAKRLAVECQREVRKQAVRKSIKAERETGRRAKRLMSEVEAGKHLD